MLEVFYRHRDRRLSEQPVANRGVARMDTSDLERHDRIAQQSHEPTDGADESLATFPIPIHRFRPRNLKNQIR